MVLNEHALSAYPLLKAIDVPFADMSNVALAKATGRSAKNLPRDLDRLAEAGWISREPGSPPALTDEGRAIKQAVERANETVTVLPPAEAVAVELPLHLIDDNPENPRETINEEADAELTEAIGARGVLQPIMVRPSTEPGRYVVIMGARRRRCSIAAGKLTIPAVIREVDDAQAFELATIENVQRDDMNPMDVARAFRRMIDDRMQADPNLTLKAAKEEVSRITGKSVRLIELRLQFMDLPAVKQVELQQGKISAKDATQWFRSQPKLLSLTPRQWMIALEVYDAQKRRPRNTSNTWESESVECRREAEDDEDMKVLIGSAVQLTYLVQSEWEDGVKNGHFYTRSPSWAATQLGLRFGDYTDDKVRAKALQAIREEAGFTGKFKAGEYATAWLNGPFGPTDEEREAIEAEQREHTRKNQEREREFAARNERERAERERILKVKERDEGDLGVDFLAKVQAFASAAPALPAAEFIGQFRAILDGYGVGGAYGLAYPEHDPDGVIVDGNGDSTASYGPAKQARRMMFVLAMNFASGLSGGGDLAPQDLEHQEIREDVVETSGTADAAGSPVVNLPCEGGEADREAALGLPAATCPGCGAPEGECGPACDGDLAGDDAETPEFLRRLAGPGQAAQAEAQS